MMVRIYLSGKAEQDDSFILFSDAESKFRKLFLHFIVKIDVSLQSGEWGESRILHPEIQISQKFWVGGRRGGYVKWN